MRVLPLPNFTFLYPDDDSRWEIVQSISLDWKIVTGKRGCLWGSLLFYFPFRILAAVSFITGILRAYPLTAKQSEVRHGFMYTRPRADP